MRLEPRAVLAGLALFASATCFAQLSDLDPDWKEQQVPPPPAVKTERLIELELPGSVLRFGVDPDSVTVGADGVVRYVVVARSASGVINAMYEGLRCNTAEVKVYARHNPDTGWTPVREADWKPLHGSAQARHSLLVARTGACMGRSANRSASQIVRDLRAPVDHRFRSETFR